MSQTPIVLHSAGRQYRHNNSDELIPAFDYELTIKLVDEMQAELDKLNGLLEAKDYVIDCAIDLIELNSTVTFAALETALEAFMPDVQTVKK